ncbi:MAG: hypothetical protein H7Y04_06925 [Verrucomicrobia bacterium]|nr:hypothetical protein [Cytophagales bacterium]
MKIRLIKSLKFILTNWRTSLLGLLVVISMLLWFLRQVNTDDFLKVLGFCSAVGLFAMKDSPQPPKGGTKEEEYGK